ncbi:hypothetical protein [Actinoplanes sp. RD1]|uniref:hypothetical protein n=1 Tax=Actinoplanes sp. RD1 TaxID=3064538 RepID=UPI002741376E|nr:hypothetical protein [Actinoplanes sp. RD1]
MTRDGVRGFVRRSLPVLLALFLTGPFAAASAAPAPVVPAAAAAAAASTASAASAPFVAPAVAVVVGEVPAAVVPAGAPQVLHAQAAAGAHGSRAPPSTLV